MYSCGVVMSMGRGEFLCKWGGDGEDLLIAGRHGERDYFPAASLSSWQLSHVSFSGENFIWEF